MPEDPTVLNKPKSTITKKRFLKRKQLERDIEHVTEQMYLRNKELADTNKILALLGTIDTIALESFANLNTVCNKITEAIVQSAGYSFIGLFSRASHNRDKLLLKGWNGANWIVEHKEPVLNVSKPIALKLSNSWFDNTLERSKLLSVEGIHNSEIAMLLDLPLEDMVILKQQLQLKAIYINKLYVRNQLVGLLVIGYNYPIEALHDTESKLFNRLSESIGIALDNKMLFEENQLVLRKLKESNTKLKELDETKDDFISMASHQLRTPLTSVKGYLSMLIEGDAGKLNATQKDMLNQSFFSSQRMVYLIADMLNVSRLKTGKFAIENTPVNLADVVEQEVEQLKETAQAHNVKFTYHKPKDFPKLMLDETKIRQVIMNFSDNSIYYTPPNGHIEVKLINKPHTIELLVIDDGIGVPKSERHHLFTKFYRAGNARKARPDGTGLGLFMAKKVIVAQGGILIFESAEGKGSTFGFSFVKSKHKPKPEDLKVLDPKTKYVIKSS